MDKLRKTKDRLAIALVDSLKGELGQQQRSTQSLREEIRRLHSPAHSRQASFGGDSIYFESHGDILPAANQEHVPALPITTNAVISKQSQLLKETLEAPSVGVQKQSQCAPSELLGDAVLEKLGNVPAGTFTTTNAEISGEQSQVLKETLEVPVSDGQKQSECAPSESISGELLEKRCNIPADNLTTTNAEISGEQSQLPSEPISGAVLERRPDIPADTRGAEQHNEESSKNAEVRPVILITECEAAVQKSPIPAKKLSIRSSALLPARCTPYPTVSVPSTPMADRDHVVADPSLLSTSSPSQSPASSDVGCVNSCAPNSDLIAEGTRASITTSIEEIPVLNSPDADTSCTSSNAPLVGLSSEAADSADRFHSSATEVVSATTSARQSLNSTPTATDATVVLNSPVASPTSKGVSPLGPSSMILKADGEVETAQIATQLPSSGLASKLAEMPLVVDRVFDTQEVHEVIHYGFV